MRSLVQTLKEFAVSVGFDRIGITSADPPEDYPHFLEWLRRGYGADLGFLQKANRVAQRGDLTKVLEGARSVIVGVVSYAPRRQNPPSDARFARYGWGADYHEVLREKLETVAAWLVSRSEKGFRYRTCVDTDPILEKGLAQRAGVGWVGKNGLVMSETTGSYVVLGEIVTTLELPRDIPATGRCGTCTKCLEACPTKALVAPYVLDPRRCISFQTLENRSGSIPPEVAEKLAGWVAGCDICQEACPWNREPLPHRLEAFSPGTHARLSLHQLARLTPEDFARWFQGTAFHRIGWKRLAQNAKTAFLSKGSP